MPGVTGGRNPLAPFGEEEAPGGKLEEKGGGMKPWGGRKGGNPPGGGCALGLKVGGKGGKLPGCCIGARTRQSPSGALDKQILRGPPYILEDL
jgi:hypothetical protein